MKIGSFKQFLTALFWPEFDEVGTQTYGWVADDRHATLINPDSGRVLAYIREGRGGKYRPFLFVSPWRALRLRRAGFRFLVEPTFAPFPRLSIAPVGLKADTLRAAQEAVDTMLTAGLA
jgi:hypothetical protein